MEKGTELMLSIPPDRIQLACPDLIKEAAKLTAFIPEAQTLLIVVAGIEVGRPARRIACVAGACPHPADKTWPKSTSSIISEALNFPQDPAVAFNKHPKRIVQYSIYQYLKYTFNSVRSQFWCAQMTQ